MRKRTYIDIDYRKDCWWGFKDVRARLKEMAPQETFVFLCVEKMAEKMDRVVALAGGKIIAMDNRSYGVVVSIQKKQQ